MFTKVLIAILILLILLFFLAISSRERERADRAEKIAMEYEYKCAQLEIKLEAMYSKNKLLSQENETLRNEKQIEQERLATLLNCTKALEESLVKKDSENKVNK